MKRLLLVTLSLLFLYLLFFPVPIDTGSWQPTTDVGYTDIFAANNTLSTTKTLFAETCIKCESVCTDSLGRIYGAAETGEIWLYENNQDKGRILANTEGRPLGVQLDSLGNLIVADAHKGLLSIDKKGQITTLTTEADGIPFLFTDDLAIAEDGIIYFTDASHKFTIEDYKLDLIEHQPNGRLLSYNPTTKKTTTLLKDLYFANGVAISPNQDFVLVNETGKYRIARYWLTGDKAGTSDLLIENLPGFPDGIDQGSSGIFWVSVISPRDPTLDALMPRPFLRKIIARLPEFLKPKPLNHACALGINNAGVIVQNLQDTSPRFAQITCVSEYKSSLYFGSLGYDGIGYFKMSEK